MKPTSIYSPEIVGYYPAYRVRHLTTPIGGQHFDSAHEAEEAAKKFIKDVRHEQLVKWPRSVFNLFNISRFNTAGALALAVSGNPVPATAYPIDCAILLCLAGGFPPSAECSAAKATMIRRITPWPIEPPLQLWNCPMGLSADLAGQLALAGISIPKPGPDGLTPDIRKFRDDIEIYHIEHYSRTYSRDEGERISDHTKVGVYGLDGLFEWVPSSYGNGPAWLADAVGGARHGNQTCVATQKGECTSYRITSYSNAGPGPNGGGTFRGVAIRTKAHDGTYQTEWVPY